MCVFVYITQRRGADVRIDLRGHETFVAEQFLYAANIGTAIEQMRGKAMPQ